MSSDPGETVDLALDPGYAEVLIESDRKLHAICNPEAINAAAFRAQAGRIGEHGGVEAILRRGDFGYTPAPGEKYDLPDAAMGPRGAPRDTGR